MLEEGFHVPCWYVFREGKQHGPYSGTELVRLAELAKLRADELVWKPGLTNWKPVRDVPGVLTPPTQQHAFPPAPSSRTHSPPNDAVSAWIEGIPSRWARNGAVLGAVWGVLSLAATPPPEASVVLLVLPLFAVLVSAFWCVSGILTRRRLRRSQLVEPKQIRLTVAAIPGRYAAWGGAVGGATALANGLLQNKFASGAGFSIGYLLGGVLSFAIAGAIIGFVLRRNLRKRFSDDGQSVPPTAECGTKTALINSVGVSPDSSGEQSNEIRFDVPGRGDTRYGNFIARHWRGEFPLWVSYWVVGFLSNLGAAIIAIVVAKIFVGDRGYQPVGIFFAFLFLWLSIGLLGTWQLVGIWRSASRYRKERGRAGKPAFWGGLAQVMTIIGLLGLVRAFGDAGLPQMAETFRMAWMGDPDIPNYSLRLMRNGTELEITGGFKYGLTDDVLRLVRASPQIGVVHLNSVGGRIGEAQKLNRVIREKGLVTFVSGQCLSACTLAYAGGKERWLRRGAVLGFHASSFPGMEDEIHTDIEQKDAFREAGFVEGFIARALATPNDDMWTPQLSELLQSNVVTAISDGSDFAASGFGGALTREQMGAKLTSALPALAALKERSPDAYASITDAFYTAYVNGETEEAAVEVARRELMPLIQSYLPLADDDVLVAYGNLTAEQYTALGSKDPELCYLYASGLGKMKNFSESIPSSLLKRELLLQGQVVATAAKRPTTLPTMTDPLWAMIGQRIGQKDLELLDSQPPPEKYRDYCEASIAMFRAITSMREKEAGLLLRELWSAAFLENPPEEAR